MTRDEFLSAIKTKGAKIASGVTSGQIMLANTSLQSMRAAMLPTFLIELYSVAGGITLGTGYIFGPTEINNGKNFPTPSIIKINQEISDIQAMRGKTIFGRNDLFWFGLDSFGNCFMLDNLTLRILRKYDDPYRAMYDCLMGGKI